MTYGEKEGAIGYLVGEENRGLEYMFIMMNAARRRWAWKASRCRTRLPAGAGLRAERVQSRDARRIRPPRRSIIRHPDVRRMLMS